MLRRRRRCATEGHFAGSKPYVSLVYDEVNITYFITEILVKLYSTRAKQQLLGQVIIKDAILQKWFQKIKNL